MLSSCSCAGSIPWIPLPDFGIGPSQLSGQCIPLPHGKPAVTAGHKVFTHFSCCCTHKNRKTIFFFFILLNILAAHFLVFLSLYSSNYNTNEQGRGQVIPGLFWSRRKVFCNLQNTQKPPATSLHHLKPPKSLHHGANPEQCVTGTRCSTNTPVSSNRYMNLTALQGVVVVYASLQPQNDPKGMWECCWGSAQAAWQLPALIPRGQDLVLAGRDSHSP